MRTAIGLMSGVDAAELMLAGANAVMVGTANLSNPMACPQIVRELSEYACGQGITKISELTGRIAVKKQPCFIHKRRGCFVSVKTRKVDILWRFVI